MANARVSKADILLNRLASARTCSLTPEGVNFVRQRFDPYHDTPVKPTGLPDDYNGVTVSRCIKRTITISQSSGGLDPTEQPWDCHIVNTPLSEYLQFKPTSTADANGCSISSFATTSQWGGLVITGNNSSGSDFIFPTPMGHPVQSVLGHLELNANDLANNMRVIAMGFEIIDGTAELYRQGILTAYRQNQPVEQDFHLLATNHDVDTTTSTVYDGSARIVKLPPRNTGSALLIPNSKQWLVKEGAYISVDFHSNPPMELPKMIRPCLQPDNMSSPLSYAQQFTHIRYDVSPIFNNLFIPATPAPVVKIARAVTKPTRFYPCNQNGVFLSGLHPLATITVNIIFYVECAPDGDDEELLTLAYPSPQLDTFSMMMVSELRRDSPVAVKLKENYMGEWFVDGVMDVVRTVTPWLANAQVVGKQFLEWGDQAKRNDGMLTSPQTIVRGSVSNKVARDNKIVKSAIPAAPGKAPMMRAFRPKAVTHVKAKKTHEPDSKLKARRIRAFDPTDDDRRRRENAIRQKAMRGDYDESQKLYTHDYKPRRSAMRSRRN